MILISILALACVVITIYSGLYLLKNNEDSSKEKIRKALKINLSTFIPIMVMILVLVLPNGVKAATAGSASETASGLKYIGAALSTGLATIGTGYAVGVVGSSALGAVSEDPSLLGKSLIYVGLAEGIAIYGLVISILILQQL